MNQFIDMTGWKMWEHGVPDSLITVICLFNRESKNYHKKWKCQCKCGKIFIADEYVIRRGKKLSCGCHHGYVFLNKDKKAGRFRKYNKYDLTSFPYGVLYASNTGNPYLFDLDDYEKIKEYCWLENNRGYLESHSAGKRIKFHNFVMGESETRHIDHIFSDIRDNRKSMLRKSTVQQNSMNRAFMSNNTSGIIGVYWSKANEKWRAVIGFNGKKIHLGYFENKDEAVKNRLQAEKKYFGEFAPQREMFEKYKV